MAENSKSYIVGRHAVAQALENKPQAAQELLATKGRSSAAVGRIMNTARAAGVKVRRVDPRLLDELSQGAAHQGVALSMAAAGYASLDAVLEQAAAAGDNALIVMADHIQDPHNLGAMVRSAAGAGAQGVIIPKDRAAPLSPAAAKAAAGTLTMVPVARVTNLTSTLETCKKAGLWALAASAGEHPAPWELDLKMPLVLVVGGEHKGVGDRLLKACDLHTSLPLATGVESLNASVAAGTLLFEIVRQRLA